jgi:hypothetical protein
LNEQLLDSLARSISSLYRAIATPATAITAAASDPTLPLAFTTAPPVAEAVEEPVTEALAEEPEPESEPEESEPDMALAVEDAAALTAVVVLLDN